MSGSGHLLRVLALYRPVCGLGGRSSRWCAAFVTPAADGLRVPRPTARAVRHRHGLRHSASGRGRAEVLQLLHRGDELLTRRDRRRRLAQRLRHQLIASGAKIAWTPRPPASTWPPTGDVTTAPQRRQRVQFIDYSSPRGADEVGPARRRLRSHRRRRCRRASPPSSGHREGCRWPPDTSPWTRSQIVPTRKDGSNGSRARSPALRVLPSCLITAYVARLLK